jgi:hypothetical protein
MVLKCWENGLIKPGIQLFHFHCWHLFSNIFSVLAAVIIFVVNPKIFYVSQIFVEKEFYIFEFKLKYSFSVEVR